jgi:cytochrome c oxidase cbb3-type subunit 4
MDLNDVRSLVTLISLAVFLGIVAWAYAKRNQQRFEELGQLPLQDDVQPSQGARDE